jgi:microcystin-dependent protein
MASTLRAWRGPLNVPRQSNGNFLQPANTAAVSATTIASAAFNTLITDIGTEITNSVDRGGRSAMTAALPMGNQKITGMADPTVSTDATTKAYVDALIAALYSTGDLKPTLKTVADTGFVMCDDGTIGSAISGASSRANADTQALFTLLFNNITDTFSPIFTSGGGATTRAAQTNAASAWAANCRISITKTLGRVLGAAGSGSGLTARGLGQTLGEETHLLTIAEIPAHTHANTLTDPGHTHPFPGSQSPSQQFSPTIQSVQLGASGFNITSNTTGITINNASIGGGTAHNVMQPSLFVNWMVKL